MNESHVQSPLSRFLTLADQLMELADALRTVAGSEFTNLHPEVSIENWSVGYRAVPVLRGYVVGHPILGDRMARTSELYFFDTQRQLARTLSRWYRLGSSANGLLNSAAEH